MRKFCVISNEMKDKHLALLHEIADYIVSRGGTAACIQTQEEGAGRRLDFDVAAVPPDTECVLVLGGDGTMIRVATRLEELPVPIAGVNLGNLGYLCELDRQSVFEAIDKMMADAYTIEERMMLTGSRTGGVRSRSALNDIVIHHLGDGMSVIKLHVYVNGEFLTTYEADGVILATATGSTGYNMSAGGPIVEPKARVILLTPVNAHSLRSKSIVFGADDVVEIELGSRRVDQTAAAGVSFDGDLLLRLQAGERFCVRCSENVTRICKLNKESFLEIMRQKME